MRKLICLLLVLCFFTCFTSCASEKSETFYSMGAFCSATYVGGADAEKAVRDTENLISARVVGSDIYKLNHGETVNLPDDIKNLLSLCADVSAFTEGKYDVFALPLTSLWDFDAEEVSVPSAEEIEKALSDSSVKSLETDGEGSKLTSGGIDLGSVGKGFGCENAVNALKNSGCKNCIVSVGGSIGVYSDGDKEYKIALRDPFGSQNDVIGVFKLKNAYVSTSGSYEKCFEKDGILYHHILDARTGLPYESDFVSVSVVSESGALSDILSTSCFMLSVEEAQKLLKKYSSEAVFVTKNGDIIATSGLKDIFSAKDGKAVSFI